MQTTTDDRIIAELMEQLIETGPDGLAAPERTGYAKGTRPKRIDTPAGTLTVKVPKSRSCDEPFYPQALERRRRSSRAVMHAIAQMYIQGVSTRDVEKVMAEFRLEGLSSSQVSRATAFMDEELEAWRNRPLVMIEEAGVKRSLVPLSLDRINTGLNGETLRQAPSRLRLKFATRPPALL